MTLAIGRCGLDVTSDEVESLDMDGNTVRIGGILYASTLADAKVLRQQLLGHVDNPDESVVPVAWSEDSTLDGFYRVRSASVSTTAVSYAANWFPFSVDLERVGGTNAVGQARSRVVGAVRTNTHGITTAYQALMLGGTSAVAATSLGGYSIQLARPGVTTGYLANLNNGATFDGDELSTIEVTPANWYTFAPKLEIGTGTKRVVVGKDCENLPLNWQISNGFLRVSSSGAGSVLNVEAHNGTSWSTAKGYQPAAQNVAASYASFGTFRSLQVLRNGVDKVVIRLTTDMPFAAGAGTNYVARVDVGLRRGARHAEIGLSFGPTASRTYRLLRTSAEGATSITGGVRATANDANGHRYVVASAPGGSANTVTGGMDGVATTGVAQFGVGVEISGSTSTTPDTAQEIAYQFFAAVDETLTFSGLS